jgi:hypothetical protein
MAVIIRGKTRCRLCDEQIGEGDEVVAFSVLVANTNDPLWRFNDAAMHRKCFDHHPDSALATRRWEEARERMGPGHRPCAACGSEVLDPDDHFSLGHLTDDPSSPLFPYNYTHLHRSHIVEWPDLVKVMVLLEDLSESGAWGGGSLRWAIDELRQFAW